MEGHRIYIASRYCLYMQDVVSSKTRHAFNWSCSSSHRHMSCDNL